jgi:hypothetical protein
MVNAKTYSQKPSEVSRRWILIDASQAPLGRVSTEIAKYLIGKYKPTYTPHIDGGDYVVVINAKDVVVTGDKETGKIYYRHSAGIPKLVFLGGLLWMALGLTAATCRLLQVNEYRSRRCGQLHHFLRGLDMGCSGGPGDKHHHKRHKRISRGRAADRGTGTARDASLL